MNENEELCPRDNGMTKYNGCPGIRACIQRERKPSNGFIANDYSTSAQLDEPVARVIEQIGSIHGSRL
jgi:hypothetical protein